jgi:hypothetical protein
MFFLLVLSVTFLFLCFFATARLLCDMDGPPTTVVGTTCLASQCCPMPLATQEACQLCGELEPRRARKLISVCDCNKKREDEGKMHRECLKVRVNTHWPGIGVLLKLTRTKYLFKPVLRHSPPACAGSSVRIPCGCALAFGSATSLPL